MEERMGVRDVCRDKVPRCQVSENQCFLRLSEMKGKLKCNDFKLAQ